MRKFIFVIAVSVVLLASIAAAQAQAYPNRPIRLLIGWPAGGGPDTVTRILAEQLSKSLGQPVVVENRPGAAGIIAGELLAKSPPDGYTLIYSVIGQYAIYPSLYKKLPYDPVKDFAPISLITNNGLVLVTSVSLPAKSLKELIAYAKANPGKISYASGGSGGVPHLAMEMLKSMTGTDMVHVPYKGMVQAIPDLLAGQVHVMFDNLPNELPNIKAGKVRALAVTTARRNTQLPQIPTFAEAGVPDFEVMGSSAMFTRAGVPKPIIARLNAELVKALNSPDVKARLQELGVEPAPSTPERVAAYQKSEIVKWAKVVKDTGATVD